MKKLTKKEIETLKENIKMCKEEAQKANNWFEKAYLYEEAQKYIKILNEKGKKK